MSKITWLHLSDLHIGSSEYNSNIVLNSLLDDLGIQLKNRNIKLDFIFITGDITFSGLEEEYILASDFISSLVDVTSIIKDNIIVVPGNHDLNRNDISILLKNIGDQINNRDIVSEIIGNDKELERITLGFKNYRNFVLENFNWAKTNKDSPLSYTINRKIGDITISVLALNSAWLAFGNKNEKGELIIGERQVREALKEIDNPDVIISLMHHPFEWLKWFDENDTKGLLERRADFILSGHEHNLDLIRKYSLIGKAYSISGGSAYDSRQYTNSYNIIENNFNTGIGTAYLRKYTDKNGGFWTNDNSLGNKYESGIISFNLQDRILKKDSAVNINDKKNHFLRIGDESNFEIMIPDFPTSLKESIKNGKCILFAGAGVSLDAGLPSWTELLKNMIDEVDNLEKIDESICKELNYLMDSGELLVVSEYCRDRLGKYEFSNFIKKNLNIKNRKSILHKYLSCIPFKGAITTNFDTFIEDMRSNTRVILPSEINSLGADGMKDIINENCFPIFKMHGTYQDTDSIILTEKDYRNAIFKISKYREALKYLFSDKSLLFIGFSFRDLNVNLFLQEIFTMTEGNSIPHYAILNDVGTIKKEYFWKSLNIKVISYPLLQGTHSILVNMIENLKNELII